MEKKAENEKMEQIARMCKEAKEKEVLTQGQQQWEDQSEPMVQLKVQRRQRQVCYSRMEDRTLPVLYTRWIITHNAL